jgi:hypothetical protein
MHSGFEKEIWKVRTRLRIGMVCSCMTCKETTRSSLGISSEMGKKRGSG